MVLSGYCRWVTQQKEHRQEQIQKTVSHDAYSQSGHHGRIETNLMMTPDTNIVRDFNHTLLWPVQLRSLKRTTAIATHYWDILKADPGPWEFVRDGLLIDDGSGKMGYEEFVYFLPYVQRFLYGVGDEGHGAQASLHVFSRDDVGSVRVTLEATRPTITLAVRRLRLYFFYDIDIAILALELEAHNVALQDAVDIMDRLGRPYPPSWEARANGEPAASHCPLHVALCDHTGATLAESDYDDQGKYLERVRDSRQTPLASHWEWLMRPLLPAYAEGGRIKFYQLENKRIPIISYLSFDNPHALSRGDMVRLGFAAKWGDSATLPYSADFLRGFEAQHCYDRYWDASGVDPNMCTRTFFCGLSAAMITQHGAMNETLRRQFRHQYYQIALIAHFHKAALLLMSNRFSGAVERLNVRDFESVKQFKRHVRETLEVFLRFNHRYWFHEISNQVQASDFFKRLGHQLGSDDIYDEVREEARDINEYLDAERARKQTDNAMRLTVVSACGMVGTIVTGFLGMNLFAHADLAMWMKALIFFAVVVPTVALSIYTVVMSKRIANFMEALSSEGLTWGEKFDTFRQIRGVKKRDFAVARRNSVGLSTGDD